MRGCNRRYLDHRDEGCKYCDCKRPATAFMLQNASRHLPKSTVPKTERPAKSANQLLRVIMVILLALTFLLSALAGHFYSDLTLFFAFALPAIAIAALAGYLPEISIDERIRDLQSQIDNLKDRLGNASPAA